MTEAYPFHHEARMAIATDGRTGRDNGSWLYGMYVAALAVCLVGNLVVRVGTEMEWIPPWGRTPLALVTAAPLALAAVVFWRRLRRDLDEMLQRIVLEGLAFAFLIYLPVAGLLVNLRAARAWTPRLDPPDIVLMPALLVGIGIAIASRRYR